MEKQITKNQNKHDLNNFSDKRILVTGASGYLATNLVNTLKNVNCTIIRLTRGKSLLPVDGKANIKDVTGDLRNKQTWQQAMEGVDIVYHFAAQTSVYVAEENPFADLESNVLPMLNLLESCREKQSHPIIIFSGTVTEAGLCEKLPVDETCPDHPITVYDVHKLMAENYLKHYSQKEVVKGTILRLANVYGPGPKSGNSDRGVINMMMRKGLNGDQLTIYGKGDYVRDYVYIDDVISAFLKAAIFIEQTNGRYFVIGSQKGNTIAQAINLIADRVAVKTGQEVQVKHIQLPPGLSPIETRNFFANTQQFTHATGWRAHYSLKEGLDETLKTFLEDISV